MDLTTDDLGLRVRIYDHFAATGVRPGSRQIADWVGDAAEARAALQRLHDAHAIVLDGDGEIRMALPFSGVATPHRVVTPDRSWWANCAWDALAIPVAMGIDADIESRWVDTGDPVELSVSGGSLGSTDGFIHFERPARKWWDDIVET